MQFYSLNLALSLPDKHKLLVYFFTIRETKQQFLTLPFACFLLLLELTKISNKNNKKHNKPSSLHFFIAVRKKVVKHADVPQLSEGKPTNCKME